ncbi:unnamed protein product [Cylicocyclus nassatus]|uniref:Glutamate decarboxylase n=1 Tax=Cylicocyclus nassatus TaxID=53992 RepID=A0AA36GVI5_CYLNA|nr:unnamed protein product [Cylicocyclus nassatus]
MSRYSLAAPALRSLLKIADGHLHTTVRTIGATTNNNLPNNPCYGSLDRKLLNSNIGAQRWASSGSTDLSKLISKEILPRTDNWEGSEKFLKAVVNVLLKYIREQNDRSKKVLDFHHPAEMLKLIDMSIPEKPQNLEHLVKECEKVLKYGVKSGHPRFFNQISCGLDLVGMAGEWLTATANTNMFTYEICPVYILMENAVLRQMYKCVGWNPDTSDGIFAPGGTISNLYGLLVARYAFDPRGKQLGLKELPKLCCFTSASSHFSIKSAAAVCGIGTDNCFYIPTDERGKMIPELLEKKIIECKNNGLHPFFVCATCGTTVYGAMDPFEEVANICKKHKIWYHVDAAWGGGLFLSPEHHDKLKGISRADSITWNPHKLMGAMLQCSACLFQKKGLLMDCNKMKADYLFMQDKFYDVSYDTGDKSIQCGRHNDVFKLWLMWKSKGMEGYREQVNMLMDHSAYFAKKVKETEGFELIMEPEFLNVCFYYVPKKLRNLSKEEKYKALDKIAPAIKGEMMKRGWTMVAYQPEKDRAKFFRLIISNQAIRREDLDFLMKEIALIGESL